VGLGRKCCGFGQFCNLDTRRRQTCRLFEAIPAPALHSKLIGGKVGGAGAGRWRA